MEYIIIGLVILGVIAWIVEVVNNYFARKRYNEVLDKAIPHLDNIDFKKIEKINKECTIKDSIAKNTKEQFLKFVMKITKKDG